MNSITCTVDVVLLTLDEQMQLSVALLRRNREPFKGLLALPGGFIHPEEDDNTREAAERTLFAKTGIRSPYLEQLGTFSGPTRDPRGWTLSVVYYALVPASVITSAAHPEVSLKPVAGLKRLPFDHKQIIKEAVARVQNKSAYSTLPAHFCGDEFTLPQLQAAYEAVLGEAVNKVSFRRRMAELDALEEVPGLKRTEGGRPAQVYRLKEAFRSQLSVLDRGLGWMSGRPAA